jgi:hypothetical protein
VNSLKGFPNKIRKLAKRIQKLIEMATKTKTYSCGDSYTGQMLNDQPEGKGIYKWANGDVYEGQWVGGSMHGNGKYTDSAGNIYEGEWKNQRKI